MEIEIKKGSLLDCNADYIVNPANSRGQMGGGVAGVIRSVCGDRVEIDAMAQAPIPVGRVVLTGGGKGRFKGIIHAPTMFRPAEMIPVENVQKATRAAMDFAEKEQIHSLGFTGMGTGVGRVSPDAAAEAMINEMRDFQGGAIQKIILVDVSRDMVAAWKTAFSK